MMDSNSVAMEDVTQVYFEYMNPSSRLVDLGHQRHVVNLSEAQEGDEHDYVVLDKPSSTSTLNS